LTPTRGLKILPAAETGSAHAATGRQRGEVGAALAFLLALSLAPHFLVGAGAFFIVPHFAVLILHGVPR
jgi:hypothetical protein